MSEEIVQRLSKNDHQVIKKAVLDEMVHRYEQRVLISEADFLAGAVTVMNSIGSIESNSVIPRKWEPASQWVYSIMGGRSLVSDILIQRGESIRAKIRQQQFTQFVRRITFLDEMVDVITMASSGNTEYDELSEIAGNLLEEIGEIEFKEE